MGSIKSGETMNTKKFIWNEAQPPVHYRPGTSDEWIIQTILVERGEYHFPAFKPEICYDIGANIGVVSVALAYIYPSAKIYAFEPVEENHELLKLNTEHLKNVRAINYGLGSDTGPATMFPSDDPNNLGGFSTAIRTEIDPENPPLVHIRDVAEVVRQFGTPDVVKIDCEGAEAEILENMPGLENVKWLAGELHGIRDFATLDLLSKHFHIECARNFEDKCWHFHAMNKTWDYSPGLVRQE